MNPNRSGATSAPPELGQAERETCRDPFESFRALSDFSNWTKQALRSFPKNTEPSMWKALCPESPECKALLWFSKSVEYSVLFASKFLPSKFLSRGAESSADVLQAIA